jgi:hypothetical protein
MSKGLKYTHESSHSSLGKMTLLLENSYVIAGGISGTQNLSGGLKVATIPLGSHYLASNQFVGLLIDLKLLRKQPSKTLKDIHNVHPQVNNIIHGKRELHTEKQL